VVTLSKVNGWPGLSVEMKPEPCNSRAAGEVDPESRMTAVNDTATAAGTTPRLLKDVFSLTNMDREFGFTTEIENSQSCKPRKRRRRAMVTMLVY
jgi:hypothetical protein